MKIGIIGGGAYSWTPELVRDIAVTPGFAGSHIALMDINPDPLELARRLCEKIVAAAKVDISISATLDQDQALSGADFVLVSINTGS
jgi:alpha-galactosidase